MEPTLKGPGAKRLKLKCNQLLSSFAFESNLRRYVLAHEYFHEDEPQQSCWISSSVSPAGHGNGNGYTARQREVSVDGDVVEGVAAMEVSGGGSALSAAVAGHTGPQTPKRFWEVAEPLVALTALEAEFRTVSELAAGAGGGGSGGSSGGSKVGRAAEPGLAFPDSVESRIRSGGFRAAPQGNFLAYVAVCMDITTLLKWIPDSGKLGRGGIRVDLCGFLDPRIGIRQPRVEPMKPVLKALGTKILILKCSQPLSSSTCAATARRRTAPGATTSA